MNPNIIGWTPEREIKRLETDNLAAWTRFQAEKEKRREAERWLSAWRGQALIGWAFMLASFAHSMGWL